MPETNFKKTEVMPGLVTEIKEHLEYCMLQDQVRLGSRLRQVRRSRARRTKDLLRIKKEAVD